MNIMLDDSCMETIEDVRRFLDGSLPFKFRPHKRDERSEWIRNILIRFKYLTLKRNDKQVLRQYLMKVSALSRAQVARHITAYRKGRYTCNAYQRNSFPAKYNPSDIELLAETDNLHERINGAATIAIMQAEYDYGDTRYERMKNISVAQLYRFRGEKRYSECSTVHEKTRSVQVPIGERRKPQPQGKPGFLRVDSVHQGDKDGQKGVYHINTVDEVTQWQVPVAVESLREGSVEPALDEAVVLFPFVMLNFHSDNGGEYINRMVQRFLIRWQAKQTKSRPRHSNDNGLVETKNGSIIRKHMTHYHIPQPYAARISRFYREHLIPYLNFHHPCAFPDIKILSNGKKQITYPKEKYMTPYKKLQSLPNWTQYLRRGITPKMLKQQANAKSPNQAARDLKKAKKELFNIIIPKYRDIL